MTGQILNILYWNIHGINSTTTGEKDKDPEFLKVAQQHDIVCLSELHTKKAISLPGFITKKQNFRRKLHKGPKIGGGIAVFVKQDIAKNFHLLPNNNNCDSIWLTTKSPEGNPTRFGFFYCSPDNKRFNFFETVNKEIEDFGKGFDTHIFGDFNARVRDVLETMSHDKFDEELGVDTIIHESPPPRNSEDMKLINKRGKEFLDICRINDLIIANGRTIGDLWGSYTCHQKRGSSVVDYLLTSYRTTEHVLSFSIGTYMPNLSDHCPLHATIRTKCILQKEKLSDAELIDLPNRYIWTLEDEVLFEDKLKSDTFKLKVEKIMAKENNPNMVHEVRDLLTDTANECNIRKTRKNRGKGNAPWFDGECEQLKQSIRLYGRKLRRNPHDPQGRHSMWERRD